MGVDIAMIDCNSQCPDCGASTAWSVGQHCGQRDGLVWYRSYRCHKCQWAVEEDNIGFPPDSLRRVLISAEGKFGVALDEPTESRLKAAKLLHDICGFSLRKALSFFQQGQDVFWVGTATEAHWIQEALLEKEIRSSVVKIDDDRDLTLVDSQ